LVAARLATTKGTALSVSTFPIASIQDAYRLVENFSQPSNVDNGHNQVYLRPAQEFPELSMQAASHAEQ
jgi:hypothetical protein